MLTDQQFIRQSLELNLFFLRIIKEHMIFLASSVTPGNLDVAKKANMYKCEFEKLLSQTLSLSDGIISPEVRDSGELITIFTCDAERATWYYTGIPIDTRITSCEKVLVCDDTIREVPPIAGRVAALNDKIICCVREVIDFQTKALENVLDCKMFTHLYPSLLHHVNEETKEYLDMLTQLQERDRDINLMVAAKTEAFWNHIMEEHAQFIRGMLDPREEELIKIANDFAGLFDILTKRAKYAEENLIYVPQVTEQSFDTTVAFREFKTQGTQGILDCQIQSVILPLLADHVLREANYYIRLLSIFRNLPIG